MKSLIIVIIKADFSLQLIIIIIIIILFAKYKTTIIGLQIK